MTATEGCIAAPHDHVDQCHQAGRAEVEAKYAALVAAVEGLASEWEATVYKLPPGYPMTVNEFCGLWFKAPLRAVLAEHAGPAEGGDQ